MAKGINRSPVRRRKGLGKVISSTITLFGRNQWLDNLPRRVRNILRRYNASLILPGDGGNNGFNTGNYTDSTGTTPATIDGKTGLVVDAAGSAVEMSAPSTGSTSGWTAYLATVSSNGTDLTITNSSANEGYVYFQQGNILSNKTYRLEFEVVSRTVTSGTVQIGQSFVTAPNLGKFSATVKATNPHGIWIGVGGPTAGNTVTIRNVKLWEITGIHALQATDGFKPVLRRGLVNLLTYSNSIDTGVWEKKCSNATPVPTVTRNGFGPNGEAAFDVSLSLPGDTEWALVRVNPFALRMKAGEKVTQAVWLKAGAGNAGKKVSIYTYDTTYASYRTVLNATLTDQWQLFLVEHTQVGSLSVTGEFSIGKARSIVGGVTNTETATSFCIAQCGLFTGTVTAQQIIDAGGIPVTTTEPKSSSLGPRYWQFDSIDDKLKLDFPIGAGWNSATIVQARKTGAVTLTGQNIEGTYYITGGGDKYGEIFVPGSLSASELALLQKFANKLSGVQ